MPQDQNPTTSWSQNMQQDSLGGGIGEEDFTKFLDLDNGFEQFQQMEGTHGHSSLETPMGRLAFGHTSMQDMASHNQEIMQNIDMSPYQPYQMYSQTGRAHHYQIPPTPVSAEMHAAKYSAQLDNTGQLMFDHHQASFTPLVSPAQTPLDNAYCMPDYVLADDFFSPLTSPAIEAQHNFASTNTTASPVDLNIDQQGNNTSAPNIRKRGKKTSTPQQRPGRSIKQSPAMKPQQKRRQFSLSSVPQDRLERVLEKASQDSRLRLDSGRVNVFASSEDSVSPEPLSEALMRPPPIPSSTGRSPLTLRPQNSDDNLPATPAMIMRMPSNQPNSANIGNHMLAQDILEDIALPDAAATFSETHPLVDVVGSTTDDQSTPTLPAKVMKMNAESTPRTHISSIQNNSHDSLDRTKRPETRIGMRGNKKRPSGTSAAVSPALRPKISPSISPLVPATGSNMSNLSAERSALYLASKSNYQNILDGTHLPGVSYPEALAENLSSKRTSHKIAEQGRRNRINIALKEIESLLPAAITAANKKEKAAMGSRESEDGSPDKGLSSQGASKASTVEMAITYIKSLQAELQETKSKLEEAEKSLARQKSSDEESPE